MIVRRQWRFDADARSIIAVDDNGEQFWLVTISVDATDDDARLIAAAPDMLAALECDEAYHSDLAYDNPAAAVCVLRRHGWNGEGHPLHFVRGLRCAAIAKARGAV
jgi:hypothetical protein